MLLTGLFLSGSAMAHSWTPTYPKLERSFVENVMQTEMLLINRRSDVEFFEISVYDSEWNPVKFATSEKIIRVPYLERREVMVYIRQQDVGIADYICTKTKIVRQRTTGTSVSSRICSRLK